MDYFRKLQELLKIERKEDERAWKELTQKMSVQDRRANGICWYPIAIRGTEMSRGDYLTVEVERTTHQDIQHLFRFGVSAQLFSNHNPLQDHIQGTINHVSADRIKITIHSDELPEWSRDGKLGIELLFDDNSYDEMEFALKKATELTEKKEHRLIRVLTGVESPAFSTTTFNFQHPSLNEGQCQAVASILSAKELAIVHGPPGTGKTTTLVQAIKSLLKNESGQILVAAPSNAAVDLLSEKLAEEGLSVVRVGNPARVSESLMNLTLDQKMAAHPLTKELKKLKRQASEYRDMAHKYKRHFGKAERDQRKALFDEARNIMKEVENSEQFIVKDVLEKAQVVTSTLVGANHFTIRQMSFHTTIIDEAGQALEPACWIPIVKSQKLVLAGDHCQLPPTVKSEEAAKAGLSTTLLEKLVALYPQAVTLLQEQYRMNESIMGFSSREFYENKLKAHKSVAQRTLFPGDEPLQFIDTAGCGFEEKTEGTSTFNPEEGAFLFQHLTKLIQQLGTMENKEAFPSIGIISPYKKQVDWLKDHSQHQPWFSRLSGRISINTIDSFQGQERDIMYISLTRSNSDSRIGFLSEIRRMNVAMTRARKKLVVIGDGATLGQSDFYADFISYAESNNGYHSAWEFMDT